MHQMVKDLKNCTGLFCTANLKTKKKTINYCCVFFVRSGLILKHTWAISGNMELRLVVFLDRIFNFQWDIFLFILQSKPMPRDGVVHEVDPI